MSVSSSTAEPGRSRLSTTMRGFSARVDQRAHRATDWLGGNRQQRLRSPSKEDSMDREAKKADKKESKAVIFLEVTGVIVAYIAIIASLAYPVVTAASGGA